VSEHEHEWKPVGYPTPHFQEVNSKRQYLQVQYFKCACGQRGFRYLYKRVTYTWNPNPKEWIDACEGV
jgi:hypothetical protein